MALARYPLAVLVAAWVTAGLSAPITSASNLLWLSSMSMPVDWMVVVEVVIRDVLRLGSVLSILIGAGYVVAFAVTGIVRIWWRVWPAVAYPIAAVVAMLAFLILLVETTFEVQLIAGNRTLEGTGLHLVAAFIGGLVFARLITTQRTGSFAIRTLAFIPLLLMSSIALNWILDPAEAAKGFGFDFATLSDLGQNTLIRDMTAFFMGHVAFLLLGLLFLSYQWFLASSIIFLFAALFNVVAIQVHGTMQNPALIFEIVLCVWNGVLGIGAMLHLRGRAAGVGERAQVEGL